jgi:NADPH:quinone reductase-like Zn-dependent oxidoreductase
MLQLTMQAVRVHRYGGPEQLLLEQIDCPTPQAGEVLVRLQAVGVLPVESKIRQGLFRDYMPVELPYLPGSAIAGVVVEVGPGVTAFQKGQAVFGRANRGAYAEYATALVENLALKPAGLSFDEAATISGGATPAWNGLFENGNLQAGQRVLIHAAAGGVGLFAVQFAHWKGAQVIGTAGPKNLGFVRSLGAKTVIDYTVQPFEQLVEPVDLVLDTVGGETLERSMKLVKPGGTLVSLLTLPSQEQAQALGIRAINNIAAPPYPSTELLQTIGRLMVAGKVGTVVAAIFPLAEAGKAHTLSQTGHGRGRIVLHPAD